MKGALLKYSQVAKITWKTMIAYQADTWLGAGVSGFRVLLSFLLWNAIFAGRAEVAGYTLPMMVTYYLIASMLSRLQYQDALAWQLATEVREGAFSKYLTRPMPVISFFLAAGLGRWSYLALVNGEALLLWAVIFSQWIVLPAHLPDLLWLLLLIPLGALCMLLFNHMIALLSLKYQDVGGLLVLKGGMIEFLSGALVPLNLLPAVLTGTLKFTPFYYIVFYPASLFLGTHSEPPFLAVLVVLIWCLAFFSAGQAWFGHARKYYEGVGI
jgi:ABC-2 type transport system permease protein